MVLDRLTRKVALATSRAAAPQPEEAQRLSFSQQAAEIGATYLKQDDPTRAILWAGICKRLEPGGEWAGKLRDRVQAWFGDRLAESLADESWDRARRRKIEGEGLMPRFSFSLATRLAICLGIVGLASMARAQTPTPVGSVFAVSTDPSAGDIFPAVDSALNGDFVVVWIHGTPSLIPSIPTPWATLARRMASDGSPLGAEFRVDTYASYAFAFQHVSKRPEAGVARLHHDVLPF